MVEVKVLAMTDEPEELVCRCARNDYYDGKVWQDDLDTVMAAVGGDTLAEKQQNLIKKLMLRGHWGVFEHPQLTLWFRVSRACMAQITRHRHVSFDIQSMRYVDFSRIDPTSEEDIHWPRTWDAEKVTTREGTRAIAMPVAERRELVEKVYTQAVDAYNALVEAGMPKEDARMLLPIGTKVNITCSMNVRAAFHIISMRGAGDAQAEIRQLSEGLEEVLAERMPLVMEVWRENKSAIERQRLSP